jgi:ParB family chromosome partitioning protein
VSTKQRPALGRGMAALLSNAAPPGAAPAVVTPISGRTLLTLPIDAIERSAAQPRKRFEEAKLEELAASIREHGVVEPILVRRHGARYRIVAGERRWRAAQRAGLQEIPAVVRDASDRQAFELALVENLQRADLNPIEESEAYDVLAQDGLTQEDIAKRVGKDRSTVANALRLLKLPEEVRDLVREGTLDMGHARAILGLEGGAEEMRKLAQRAVREGLSVRATEALVRLKAMKGKKKPATGPSAAVKDLSRRLQRRLGARCRVVPKSAVAGRLEVEYTSLDELDGILAKIGA